LTMWLTTRLLDLRLVDDAALDPAVGPYGDVIRETAKVVDRRREIVRDPPLVVDEEAEVVRSPG
jgi:hypothetical protein